MDKRTLKKELEERGHGAQSALAEYLGVNPSIVSRMLNSPRKLRDEEIARIEHWLSRTPKAEAAQAPPWGSAPSTTASPAQPAMPVDFRRKDMPLWAAAQGGDEGAMIINTSPIDWIPRPRELQVFDAFAVYLRGESMSPAYDEGDQLWIHPHLPPKSGDDCLFVKQVDATSFLGLVKRLVRASHDKWRVEQFNPRKEFDLDRRKWSKVWKIVGKMNRA